MTVETAPAPETLAPPDEDEDEYDIHLHSVLYWLAVIALVVGIVGIAGSRLWSANAHSLLKFPTYDQTVSLQGRLVYHLDPTTLTPLPSPREVAFTDERHTNMPGLLQQQALIVTTDTVTVAGVRTSYMSQYAVDVGTLQNTPGAGAWAFVGTYPVDRSPAYSVNLPFDSGSGPFPMWADDIHGPVSYRQVGQPFTVDGVTVRRLRGHVEAAGVDPVYMAQLAHAGVPAGVTLANLRPDLLRLGVDVAPVLEGVRAKLNGADLAALDAPIPIAYTVTGDSDLLVEPRAGTIVSVDRSEQTFSGRVDPVSIGQVAGLLGQHKDVSGVSAVMNALTKLQASPPAVVFDLRLAQTKGSVSTMARWATQQRDWVNRMEYVIPTVMLVAGAVLGGVGILTGIVAWRRRDSGYVEE